jgi:predicted RNA-binding protein Jag
MPAQPKETLEKILALLDFPAAVEEHKLDDGLLLDVKTEEPGRLIGRRWTWAATVCRRARRS